MRATGGTYRLRVSKTAWAPEIAFDATAEELAAALQSPAKPRHPLRQGGV